jgi:hypothetical protein
VVVWSGRRAGEHLFPQREVGSAQLEESGGVGHQEQVQVCCAGAPPVDMEAFHAVQGAVEADDELAEFGGVDVVEVEVCAGAEDRHEGETGGCLVA